ncbi:MAG: heptaprenyl diphosphate synthase [Peptococcaceae bacterium]|nr:heptaprenyl diphosphate synthase [Peptococcaceae bacterium]
MLAIFNDIKAELQMLENELEKTLHDADSLIQEASTHLINAGGKRLRPAFCFLGAKFHNYSPERVMNLAVALELIHMASLVHDDVVDSSVTRRNIPTVKSIWGNKVSSHLGDYLFGQSLKLIATYQNRDIGKTLADTSVKMSEGEIAQLAAVNQMDQTLKNYFYSIKGKTALFISDSCYLGAIACGAPVRTWQSLKKYGNNIGMAFQITDDIMDLVADQKRIGKPVGSDLRQGVITLPVIYALKNSNRKEELGKIISGNDKGIEMIERACEIIISSGGIEYADEIARKYVDKALNEIKYLPDVPAKSTLEQVAEFIKIRNF